MKKAILGFLAAASAIGLAQPADASVILPNTTHQGVSKNAYFLVTDGNPLTGTDIVNAIIGDLIKFGSAAHPFFFTDDFRFRIGPGVAGNSLIGLGSGSVTTGGSILLGATDLDLTSVTINNGLIMTIIPIITHDGGLTESATLGGEAIYSGKTIDLIISGYSRGHGQFAGNLTYEPNAPVPETSTWAMMLLGFSFLGMAFRRRPRLAMQAA